MPPTSNRRLDEPIEVRLQLRCDFGADEIFNQRTIRTIIINDAYLGQKGYPRIVSAELAVRARDQIVRLDPAEVQRRKGGRRPKEPYMLRSIAFCAPDCGAPLYRSYAYGGRSYVCAHKLQAGACSRPPIPAELLEGHVLNHLSTFVGSVEGWIAGGARLGVIRHGRPEAWAGGAVVALVRANGVLGAEGALTAQQVADELDVTLARSHRAGARPRAQPRTLRTPPARGPRSD